MKNEYKNKPRIGDRVRGTVNNTDWHEGTYDHVGDSMYYNYGVLLDNGKVCFFTYIEKLDKE